MDRKAELERKKAKLAAIREEKERRRREKEVKDMEDATNKIVSGQDKDSRRYVFCAMRFRGIRDVTAA